MKSMSPQVSEYFDGDLPPDEATELREWLLDDSKHVDEFVVDCFVHTQLIDLLSAHQVRADELVAAESVPKPTPAIRARHSMSKVLALVASFLFVVVFTYLMFSRPKVVATISGTRDVKWVTESKKRTVGALLQAGDEIALNQGALHITFARGGQVVLHGPARFHLDSDFEGRLIRGSLSAFVPEHAVGFTVRAGRLAVVDLGTEYRLNLFEGGSSEIQVFSGLIEVQFDKSASGALSDKKLQISQGRGIRFDAEMDSMKAIEYDATARLPSSTWSQ